MSDAADKDGSRLNAGSCISLSTKKRCKYAVVGDVNWVKSTGGWIFYFQQFTLGEDNDMVENTYENSNSHIILWF